MPSSSSSRSQKTDAVHVVDIPVTFLLGAVVLAGVEAVCYLCVIVFVPESRTLQSRRQTPKDSKSKDSDQESQNKDRSTSRRVKTALTLLIDGSFLDAFGDNSNTSARNAYHSRTDMRNLR